MPKMLGMLGKDTVKKTKERKTYDRQVAHATKTLRSTGVGSKEFTHAFNNKMSLITDEFRLSFEDVADNALNERFDPVAQMQDPQSRLNKMMSQQMYSAIKLGFLTAFKRGCSSPSSLVQGLLTYGIFKMLAKDTLKQLKKDAGVVDKKTQSAIVNGWNRMKNDTKPKDLQAYGALNPNDITPQTAAMLKLHFGIQAYGKMRQPGANVTEISEKYKQAIVYINGALASNNFSKEECLKEQGVIFAYAIQQNPELANVFEETAGPYGIEKATRYETTMMMDENSEPYEDVIEVWDGFYRQADGSVFTGDFTVRTPKTPEYYMRKVGNATGIYCHQARCGTEPFEPGKPFIDESDDVSYSDRLVESYNKSMSMYKSMAEDDGYSGFDELAEDVRGDFQNDFDSMRTEAFTQLEERAKHKEEIAKVNANLQHYREDMEQYKQSYEEAADKIDEANVRLQIDSNDQVAKEMLEIYRKQYDDAKTYYNKAFKDKKMYMAENRALFDKNVPSDKIDAYNDFRDMSISMYEFFTNPENNEDGEAKSPEDVARMWDVHAANIDAMDNNMTNEAYQKLAGQSRNKRDSRNKAGCGNRGGKGGRHNDLLQGAEYIGGEDFSRG